MKNILISIARSGHSKQNNCKHLFKAIMLTVLLSLWYTAHAQQQTYTVTVKIANAKEANKGNLLYYVDATPVITTAKLKNGMYIFKGIAPGPVIASFFLDDRGLSYKDGPLDKIYIRLENGKTTITATYSVKYAKVTAGPYNRDYQHFKTFMAHEDNLLGSLNAQYYIGLQNKMPKPESDTIIQERIKAAEMRKMRIRAYVKMYPDSYSSIDALSGIMGIQPDLTVVQPLFDGLSMRLKQTPAGLELSKKVAAARDTKAGSMAPLFTLSDTSGKQISLKDFRGKYVLLDFWASWCGPCRAENPNYITNYRAYHQKGFEMLGISLDQPGGKKQWIGAIQHDGLLWPQVSELKFWSGEVNKLYGVRLVPQNFLIDPSGKIIATNLRGAELGKKLKEIFDK